MELRSKSEQAEIPPEPKKIWPIVTVVVLIVLAVVGVVFWSRSTQPVVAEGQASETPAPIVVADPVVADVVADPESVVFPPQNKDGQTVTSSELGVSFFMADVAFDSPVKTATVGNRLYVYVEDGMTNPEEGQWIEMFKKDSAISLSQAITQDFLITAPVGECTVTTTGIERATIMGTVPAEFDGAPYENPNCPAEYQVTNGISYFYMDPTHSDRYYFISIGQYGIKATNGGDAPWQDTITTIDLQ